MTRIGQPFDITLNFWEINWPFRYLKPFSKLYDEDETENKDFSSKQMWCVVLLVDQSKGNLARELPQNQKEEIAVKYFPMFDIKDEVIQQCIAAYPSAVMTSTERAFSNGASNVNKLETIITRVVDHLDELTMDNPAALIDKDAQALFQKAHKMKADMLKIYQQQEQIRNLLKEEEGEAILYGGGTENFVNKRQFPKLDDE